MVNCIINIGEDQIKCTKLFNYDKHVELLLGDESNKVVKFKNSLLFVPKINLIS